MQLDVIVDGQTYTMQGNTYAMLQEYDGWDSAPIRRLSQSGPMQHGETDLGYRLEPRLARLLLFMICDTETALFTRRRQMLRILAPRDDPHKFRFTVGSSVWEFEGNPTTVEMPRELAEGLSQRVVVRVRCADPTCYVPTAEAVTFGLGGGSDALTIPLEIPMVVGASTLDASKTITYTGDVSAYPTLIRITGPITNCIITNNETGEKIDLTGTTIATADYYDIDCRYSSKTVTNKAGTSKIDDLTSDSDLATFHLAAPVDGSASRNNSIGVTGSSVTEATEVELTYNTRFSGI